MAQIALKRSLSLPLITFYGLGTILGAGIYVLIGKVAGAAGMYAPISFGLAAVIAGFTAFSYAELSARYPRSAGEAVYVQQAFHASWLSSSVGWAVVATGIISTSTMANGFVGYLSLYIELPDWLIIIGLIISLGILAAWGISESAWVATIITILEVVGLCMVLIIAGDNLAELPARWNELVPPFSSEAWLGISLGSFLAFYAFIGFEDMVNVAEEVKEPTRIMPVAITLALIVAAILYVLVAVTAVMSLPPKALAVSDAPLASILEAQGWDARLTIGLIGLIAVINGALIQIIMASRILYGMGRQGLAPRWFSKVNARTQTPLLATAMVTVIVLMLALWLPLVTLAKATSFVILSVFSLVNLALWRLKTFAAPRQEVVSYPLWVPVIGFVLSLSLLVLQINVLM